MALLVGAIGWCPVGRVDCLRGESGAGRARDRRGRAAPPVLAPQPVPQGSPPPLRPYRSRPGPPRGTDDEHAAAVQTVREAIARGEVYQANVVGHRSAPHVAHPHAPGHPGRQPARRDLRRRRHRSGLGGGVGVAGTTRTGRGPAHHDRADQGDPPRGAGRAGAAAGQREGPGRARHDRRSRAQRPVPDRRNRIGAGRAGCTTCRSGPGCGRPVPRWRRPWQRE